MKNTDKTKATVTQQPATFNEDDMLKTIIERAPKEIEPEKDIEEVKPVKVKSTPVKPAKPVTPAKPVKSQWQRSGRRSR